jgi:methylphosphotriester-DNA--protein-cysteine methyltransferase
VDRVKNLDPAEFERARLKRDSRYDGRFFTGVITTGVYCRPICPAPPAKSRNVRYFLSAAAAEQAGFRPCLRCRPEAAPGSPAWKGTTTSVSRALRLIREGALDEGGIEELAARLGIGSRHLRRLFARHVGASPIAVAQTRRIHAAKRMIDETDLPMTEVALASGFSSVRRFNATFRAMYGRTPSELRELAK